MLKRALSSSIRPLSTTATSRHVTLLGCMQRRVMVVVRPSQLFLSAADFSTNHSPQMASSKKLKKKNNQKVSIADRLLTNGEFHKALVMFNEVLESDPEEVAALCSRAIIHATLGSHKAALTDSEKANSLDLEQALLRNMFEIHVNLLNRLARYEDLLKYGNSVVEMAKKYGNDDLKNTCTRIMSMSVLNGFMRQGNYEAALKFFEEKVQLGMNNFDDPVHLWHLKAQLLLKVGKYEDALEITTTYLRPELAGEAVQLFYQIYSLANSFLGNVELTRDALKNWEELVEHESAEIGQDGTVNQVVFNHTRAKIYSMRGNRASLDMFRDALNMAHKESLLGLIPEVLADMAIAESVFGMKDSASKHMSEALSHVPGHRVWSQMKFE